MGSEFFGDKLGGKKTSKPRSRREVGHSYYFRHTEVRSLLSVPIKNDSASSGFSKRHVSHPFFLRLKAWQSGASFFPIKSTGCFYSVFFDIRSPRHQQNYPGLLWVVPQYFPNILNRFLVHLSSDFLVGICRDKRQNQLMTK